MLISNMQHTQKDHLGMSPPRLFILKKHRHWLKEISVSLSYMYALRARLNNKYMQYSKHYLPVTDGHYYYYFYCNSRVYT